MQFRRRCLPPILILGVAAVAPALAVEPTERNLPVVLAHSMPWFQAKPVSPQCGRHLTMNHFDPDSMAGDGRREIASHVYPRIGP